MSGLAHEPPHDATRLFSANQVARARTLLARLYSLRRAARLYPADHPALLSACDELLEVLRQYHAEGVDVPLTFADGEVFLGGQLLPGESVQFDQFVRDLVAIGVQSVTFKRGLLLQELAHLAIVLTRPGGHPGTFGWGAADAKMPHIAIGTVSVIRDVSDLDRLSGEEKAAYAGALDLVRELDRFIRSGRELNVAHVRRTVQSLVDNVVHNRAAMLELSGLKSHDEYTFYHSVNVAILSLAMGSALSKEHRFLSSLGAGALLHDIGKMRVDASIINKKGALTVEEWSEMRRHPEYGAQLAALTSGLDRSVMVCVLEHHMRYDGSGYPEPVLRRPQALMSRIVAVADVFDAMTSDRSYSDARLQDEAMMMVGEMAGTILDPDLVRLLVRLLGSYPPRSLVLLDTGEIGIVVRASADAPRRPVVRIITDAYGIMAEPFDIDLAGMERDSRADAPTVVRCLDPAAMNIEVSDYL